MTTIQLTETIDRLLSQHGPHTPLGTVVDVSLRDVLDIATHPCPQDTTARAMVCILEEARDTPLGEWLGNTPLGEWLADTIPADDATDVCRERTYKEFPLARNKEESEHPMGDDDELFFLDCCEQFPVVPDVNLYK